MKLDNFIKTNGMTYEEFAKSISVAPPTVSRYAKGKRKPKDGIMRRINKVTNGQVTANDFYT